MDSSQSPAAGGNGTLISHGNDAAASASGADDSMQNLSQISNSIEKTLGLIHQLSLTVSTFNSALQMPLLQRMYCSSISLHISFVLFYSKPMSLMDNILLEFFPAMVLLRSLTTWSNWQKSVTFRFLWRLSSKFLFIDYFYLFFYIFLCGSMFFFK